MATSNRILITGATGFIGRALCERLLAGAKAVRAAVWREEPAVSLPPGVESVPVDSIGPDTAWAEALKSVDTVIHLAARVHVMDETAADPLGEYRRVNVAGTERLARECASAGVKRLVMLSSVKVLGEETDSPYTENSVPAPLDPYGVSKLEAEEVLKRISAETGLEIVVIRPPLVYGPGVKANFYRLLRLVEAGFPMPLASVRNARSLVYLGNLVDAIALCADRAEAAGQTFLVSDGGALSTTDLVRGIALALGRPARLFPFPPSLMRLAGRLAGRGAAVDRLLGSLAVDSSRINRVLGWRPPFTVEQGLKETARWYLGRRA